MKDQVQISVKANVHPIDVITAIKKKFLKSRNLPDDAVLINGRWLYHEGCTGYSVSAMACEINDFETITRMEALVLNM